MNLELRSFATFREAMGQKTIEREYEEGATVGAVLADLESEFDGLEGRLLDDDGEIQPQLSILKNGRDVTHAQGPETPLEAGDTVSLFPPVAGGSA
ncbi:small archaeal modifier protein 3 [Halalkalicoccus paucihalophilus]|jgi:sulfur-carrier protein|uniref:Small archaeal modifier protein 3 n=1 Tax=Halalkalicoccus paucihalophilus TaxID=1008153 RepID=A0A151AF81_9EURY|nr:ubiquitin-like small modifier protein 1 [Halalkalicoccus paucihalophilus]KYH26202.1 small archaeal modifier protein 3 [Halalkalicoccus paucihalophilus]